MNKPFLLLALLPCLMLRVSVAQDRVIDKVVAVVGNKVILRSDIEVQYHQYLSQGNYANEKIKCSILDQLLLNKLLLHQSIIDSIPVTDAQINEKLDRNIEFYIKQIGSKEKLEAYYGKTVVELKDEYRPMIKEQLQIQGMQQKITKNIAASPADVRQLYNNIPQDSLPYINSEVEYAQVVKLVTVSDAEKQRIRSQLNEYRDRILKGEEFATLAVLYSQDGSARSGGELGFRSRGELVSEFEAVAFRLKPGEVSEVVETKFGYHLIQLIERRGEQINVRHILLKPKVASEDLVRAKAQMDSLYNEINSGKISFSEAAEKMSDDVDTRYNGGNVFNPQTGTTRFESDQVDPAVFFQLEKLKPGEISIPLSAQTEEGNPCYKMYFLKTRTLPHRANLTDDYQRLQEVALDIKHQKVLEDWMLRKKKNTYIKIDPEYLNCENISRWLN